MIRPDGWHKIEQIYESKKTMSEEPGVYMELKFSLQALDSRLQAINTDPTASYWLKRAVTELWERDVVDAVARASPSVLSRSSV